MRARLRLLPGLLAMLMAVTASAEPVGTYFYVAPHVGYTVFDGDLRFPIHALRDNVDYGARVGFHWTNWLGLEASGGLTSTKEDFGVAREVRFLHGAADLVLTPFGGRIGGPYILLGGGAGKLSTSDAVPDTIANEAKQGHYDVGGGLQFWFTDAVGLRLEARDKMWFHHEDLTEIRAHILQFGAAATWAIGATPRDTDLDGVPDRKDQCPGTPRGAKVDAAGCPIDSDGDLVFDGIDQCPDTPRGATVDARGCPSDADGDAVFDGLDQCADTPRGATVDARGCPSDADQDSVYDGIDQCPDTPRGATVDARGCPSDADKDGVFDGLDKCPDTSPGLRVDKDGCPIEVIERETELLDTGMMRLQDINFETAKWDLPPDALPQLRVIGQVLTKWPDLRIEIGGHTDSRGSEAYNRDLSLKRVGSVLEYLLAQFPELKKEQYTTRGYGESQPIAPNTTPLNMSKNRRVEFKVLNTDVLRKEVERRRLLRQE